MQRRQPGGRQPIPMRAENPYLQRDRGTGPSANGTVFVQTVSEPTGTDWFAGPPRRKEDPRHEVPAPRVQLPGRTGAPILQPALRRAPGTVRTVRLQPRGVHVTQ